MSDEAEKPTNNNVKGCVDKADDGEAEEDVILGDGFAVVDDVKADDSKSTKEDEASPPPSQKPTSETDASKSSGENKAEKVNKTEAKVTKAESKATKTETKTTKTETKTTKSEKAATKHDEDVKSKTKSEPVQNGEPEPEKKPESAAKTAEPVVTGKQEKPSPTKETDKSLSEPKEDALLITAEDDIDEAETEESKRSRPTVNGKPTTSSSTSRSKSKGPPSMWVSNIARRVKATDLKRVFSKHGRVVTAKIVTNGKTYFGYVSMDSEKSIERCIKHLNNTRLGEKKITISSERPDAPKRKQPGKKTVSPVAGKNGDAGREKSSSKTSDGDKKSADGDKKKDKTNKTKEKEASTPPSPQQQQLEDATTDGKKAMRKRIEAPKRDDTVELKREVRRQRTAADRLTRRLGDEQARSHTMQMRAKRFERAFKELDDKLRDERKAWERERETLLKKNRLEQIKLEAERDIMEKERLEMRRRREDLERELRKLGEMQRAAAAAAAVVERSRRRKSRSVTPPPPPQRVVSSKRLKSSVDSKHEAKKAARWSGDRTRTPPPPPKLTPSSEGRGSKRDHDHHHHHFYDERSSSSSSRRDTAVYVPTGYHESGSSREGRHRSSGSGGFPPETKSTIVVPARSSWGSGGLPPPDQWRSGGGEVSSSAYGGERYRSDPYHRTPSGSYSGQSSSRGGEDVHGYAHARVSEHSRGVSDHSRSDPEYRRPVHYESNPRKY